jgi:hypothetical protein
MKIVDRDYQSLPSPIRDLMSIYDIEENVAAILRPGGVSGVEVPG